MGNGVSGKASANLKTIYLEVDGRKQKVMTILKGTHLCVYLDILMFYKNGCCNVCECSDCPLIDCVSFLYFILYDIFH